MTGPDCDCGFLHGHQHGCPPRWLVERARAYVATAEAAPPRSGESRDDGGWQFATSMAANPHWYVVRQKAWAVSRMMVEGHEALYELIRWFYYLRFWHGRGYRSIDLDGYSYWIINDGTVINRKPVSQAGWDQV